MAKLTPDPGVLSSIYGQEATGTTPQTPTDKPVPAPSPRRATKAQPWDEIIERGGNGPRNYLQVHLPPELRAILYYCAETTLGESMKSITVRALETELQRMLKEKGIAFDVSQIRAKPGP